MKRSLYKFKRWFAFHRRLMAMTALLGGLLGLAVWIAISTDEEPKIKDFGDSRGSAVALVEDSVAYAKAVKQWQEGDQVAARRTMLWLAPLADAGARTQGYGKAHLWLARQLLDGGLGEYLELFPISAPRNVERAPSGKLAYHGRLPDDSRMVARARQHLEDAVELSPQLDEALSLLVQLLVAKDRRNEAARVLLEHASATELQNMQSAILLAHALAYDGDDLMLEEQLWLELTLAGREVSGTRRGELPARLRYLLLAFVLDKQELIEVAMQSFEKDFLDRAQGRSIVTRMKALRHYFQAATAVRQSPVQPRQVVGFLAKAYDVLPGNPAVVKALEQVADAHPEMKAEVLEVLKSTPTAAIRALGSAGHAWCMTMARLMPETRMESLLLAHELEPNHPGVVTTLLQLTLEGGQQSIPLEALTSKGRQLLEKLPDEREAMRLELVLGEAALTHGDRDQALRLLERALAKKRQADSGEIGRMHRSLAAIYRDLGQVALAQEHEKRAK